MKIQTKLKQVNDSKYEPINVIKFDFMDYTFMAMIILTMIGGLIN